MGWGRSLPPGRWTTIDGEPNLGTRVEFWMSLA